MQLVVLLILAVIWAAVLVPPMLRARAEGSPVDSIGDFRRQLSVLERTTPAAASGHRIAPFTPSSQTLQAAPVVPVRAPMTPVRARQRRRQVLTLLSGSVPVTLLGAVVSGGVAWGMFVLSLGLLAGYVALLVRARNLAAEREMKVRFLPGSAPGPRTVAAGMGGEWALQQSAN